jgi:hypothetical protein
MAHNIFNRPNLDSPIDNLSSPRFGQSTATPGAFDNAGRNSGMNNCRINIVVTFDF